MKHANLHQILARIDQEVFATERQKKEYAKSRSEQPFKALGIHLTTAEVLTLLDDVLFAATRSRELLDSQYEDAGSQVVTFLRDHVASKKIDRILDAEHKRTTNNALVVEERTCLMAHEVSHLAAADAETKVS